MEHSFYVSHHCYWFLSESEEYTQQGVRKSGTTIPPSLSRPVPLPGAPSRFPAGTGTGGPAETGRGTGKWDRPGRRRDRRTGRDGDRTGRDGDGKGGTAVGETEHLALYFSTFLASFQSGTTVSVSAGPPVPSPSPAETGNWSRPGRRNGKWDRLGRRNGKWDRLGRRRDRRTGRDGELESAGMETGQEDRPRRGTGVGRDGGTGSGTGWDGDGIGGPAETGNWSRPGWRPDRRTGRDGDRTGQDGDGKGGTAVGETEHLALYFSTFLASFQSGTTVSVSAGPPVPSPSPAETGNWSRPGRRNGKWDRLGRRNGKWDRLGRRRDRRTGRDGELESAGMETGQEDRPRRGTGVGRDGGTGSGTGWDGDGIGGPAETGNWSRPGWRPDRRTGRDRTGHREVGPARTETGKEDWPGWRQDRPGRRRERGNCSRRGRPSPSRPGLLSRLRHQPRRGTGVGRDGGTGSGTGWDGDGIGGPAETGNWSRPGQRNGKWDRLGRRRDRRTGRDGELESAGMETGQEDRPRQDGAQGSGTGQDGDGTGGLAGMETGPAETETGKGELQSSGTTVSVSGWEVGRAA
ncbi:putative per-hexamer repeat protein 5 [Pseudoliparis swirei]|uniref:putative per-hexamer repeat protein 5 n=1 Tax=Pseudoliparis swirei TaxID=2059687 RepID=UPI0024BDA704|nr:putative per-hexamer repeat protein 5 [Pseudoliparis swirei]